MNSDDKTSLKEKRIFSRHRSENSILWRHLAVRNILKNSQTSSLSRWHSSSRINTEESDRLGQHIRTKVSSDSELNVEDSRRNCLPPIALPPIYLSKGVPIKYNESKMANKGPLSPKDWEELHNCRYLRPALQKYRLPELTKDENSTGNIDD
ncbi:unnamed protein product [Mytilus coruscus]|uniref:Uncharacterized protein n=1 Tax=Mytilus coruscus TaxID=42192 RepID=A0A6J8CJX4_MYTCO|nr:unnamed protein product [Mytilus coruscus]